MLLNDSEIRKFCEKREMIQPFVPKLVRHEAVYWDDGEQIPDAKRVISYGLSSFGYDIRVADDFLVFDPIAAGGEIVDPKNLTQDAMQRVAGKGYAIIPPNSFALARSYEYMKIPENVLGVVYGKSTYARCGIITNVTPLEPGWEGQITLEISNTTPLPAKIYAEEGLCQVLFLKGNRPRTTYADRKGKYQGQTGITLPKA